LIAYAAAIETAKGSPSGTATMMIVMASVISFKNVFIVAIASTLSSAPKRLTTSLMERMNMIKTEARKPRVPILLPSSSSLSYRGVCSSFPMY